MKSEAIFWIDDSEAFKVKTINWLRDFDTCCVLDSHCNDYPSHKYDYHEFDTVVAAGVSQEFSSENGSQIGDIENITSQAKEWLFGFLSYDLKNSFEKLESNNLDFLHWPDYYFFCPQIIMFIGQQTIKIRLVEESNIRPEDIFKSIHDSVIPSQSAQKSIIKARLKKTEYVNRVEKLRKHILRGDLYEVNYCQEFYGSSDFDPYLGYIQLNKISPTPFSSFFRLKSKFLLTASPERFLKKVGSKIVSQPIKGTAPRGKNPEEDKRLMKTLVETKKERAENIMIVDLVRNDLSKIAKSGSVRVEELCGIYTFKQVHQLISTVSATTATSSFEKIMRATFPMGSMTGAPKINAMKLSEKYETTKRGLYSGSVGYITPENNFDFNVVIRSLQYNTTNKYLSLMVGGAITYLSDAEKEYEECLLKASAINALLNSE